MHIILCSDNAEVREHVATFLGNQDDRLTTCDSGMELLAVVRAVTADAVVLDLGTHGLGGLLLVSAVQELAPGLPILAVSATVAADARPLVQRGIPYASLAANGNGEIQALLSQLTSRRGATLGAAFR